MVVPKYSTGYGFCKCGCGRKTEIATQTENRNGYVKGQPKNWCHGHSRRVRQILGKIGFDQTGIPDGLCQCGCGGQTKLATRNNRTIGKVKGEPLAYIEHHNSKHRKAKLREARGVQWCGACKQELPRTEFRLIVGKIRTTCNPCSRKISKATRLLNSYGLTTDQYQEMFILQQGLCAICNNPPSGKGRNGILQVDHDHETGKVRGLLCGLCNSGIGHFKDNCKVMLKAIEYLEIHRD